jgi:hypothetical protein
MSIWQFQRQIAHRLFAWGVFSVILGGVMLRGRPFWRALGGQFIVWGAIDAAIAFIGNLSARQRLQNDPHSLEPDTTDQETRKLSRLLWLNSGLDVGYVLGGAWLMRRTTDDLRGAGWGVLIQGGFLLIFDLFHALTLPPTRKAWRFWDFEHGGATAQRPVTPDLE